MKSSLNTLLIKIIKLNMLIELGLDLKSNNHFTNVVLRWALKMDSFCVLDRVKGLGLLHELNFKFEHTYRNKKWLSDNGFNLNQNTLQ